MSRAYFATVIAVFVTTSLATNLLVVGTRGPIALGLPGLRFRSRRLGRRLRRFVDNHVAAMIARRERTAAVGALRYMSDRDLKDIGLYRGGFGHLYGMTNDQRWHASATGKIDGK
jgi:uncharacterized protein YjiS (DUF1127 family)